MLNRTKFIQREKLRSTENWKDYWLIYQEPAKMFTKTKWTTSQKSEQFLAIQDI